MGSTTSQERFAACKQLLDYGFANYALAQPELSEDAWVPVSLGAVDAVRAVPAGDTKLLIDKSQKGSLTTKISLEPSVAAPVSKGQRLGVMTLCAGEQVLAQVNMVAQESVPKLTLGDIFIRILRKMCMAR